MMLSLEKVYKLDISRNVTRLDNVASDEINYYLEILWLYNNCQSLKTFLILLNLINLINQVKFESSIKFVLSLLRNYLDLQLFEIKINYLNFRDHLEEYFNDNNTPIVDKLAKKIERYEFNNFNVKTKVASLKKYLLAFNKADDNFKRVVLAMMIYHQTDLIWSRQREFINNLKIKEELILYVNAETKE
jgi:hypothetical protein